MAKQYKQPNLASAVRFEKAPLAELEFSKMKVAPHTYTTYNAGDIVPIRAIEVLPHQTIKMDMGVINRLLSAVVVPTMGSMQLDVFAFFSSIREVNDSWKNVMGENTSGYWTSPEVELAPLYRLTKSTDVQIPVGSVADYYGLPTQAPIKASVLHQMNDTLFRQYLSIYNNYFRDENYQPMKNFSKLNVYEGFLEPANTFVRLGGEATGSTQILDGDKSDGAYADGAVVKAIYGDGYEVGPSVGFAVPARLTDFSALDKPLKANKLHDEFTSVLPSPQRGPEIFFGVQDTAPIITETELHALEIPIKMGSANGTGGFLSGGDDVDNNNISFRGLPNTGSIDSVAITKTNLIAKLSDATGVSINDLRKSAAIQQIYEQLARGGARYREFLKSFFGLDIENPFKDMPTQLGHFRMELDMYQVAQTSPSVAGSTAQGSLSAYGYTDKNDYLFNYTAIEHGYIHILCVVRQPNLYSTSVNPMWFRRSTLDWYFPQLANIGEQPMKLALLNPFHAEAMERVIGYQEAWYEYRYESDICTGLCRSGLDEALGRWTYADGLDLGFTHVNGDWLKSNAQEVLDRSLAVTSELSPQFIACFTFYIEKEIPMPTYSVPGLDII